MTNRQDTITPDKARLLARANEQHAAHPQYDGHWDNWVVARAKKDIKQRGELALRKGETCLLDPASFIKHADGKFPDVVFVTVYLSEYLSSGCNTSRRASDFEVIG